MSFVVTPGDTLTAIPVPLSQGGTSTNNAATARTNLGATTVGANLFTLTNPGAVTFPQLNADNTVSALGAAAFRSAIGAGVGNGSVTSVAASAGSGISITGSPITGSGTLGITNTGVTGLTAGTGISLSGSTGNVTVSATGGSPWVFVQSVTMSNSTQVNITIPTGYENVVILFSSLRANNYTQPMYGYVRLEYNGTLYTSNNYYGTSFGQFNYGAPSGSSIGGSSLIYVWQNAMIPKAGYSYNAGFAGAQINIGGANSGAGNFSSSYNGVFYGQGGQQFSNAWVEPGFTGGLGRITKVQVTFEGSGGSGGFGVDGQYNVYGIKNS